MSSRLVLIASVDGGGLVLLYHRAFLTVEKRCRQTEGDHYVAVPDRESLVACLGSCLRLHVSGSEFSQERDSCLRGDQKPVYEVKTSNGSLWPFLVVEQHGLLYGCLPLVEQGSHRRPPLVEIPGISTGFSLLLGMAEFLGQVPKNLGQADPRFAELALYISQVMPFGTPVLVEPHLIRLVLQGTKAPPSGAFGDSSSHTQKGKLQAPAWRPVQAKGTSGLTFTLMEHIRAIQYDSPSIADVWEVYGSVMCSAVLEGVAPEVSATLTCAGGSGKTTLDHVIVHPCVKHTNSSEVHEKQLVFVPPNERYLLCHYHCAGVAGAPIKGAYQMRGETSVELLVQLHLVAGVKNNFEYCELHIPFFHRGPVASMDPSPSQGTVTLSSDKKIIIWNIGQRFPSKALEVQLKASVQFKCYRPEQGVQGEDPFCVGNNAYVQLVFKIPDFTQSGVTLDPKAVVVRPPVKCKTNTVATFQNAEYKIWNSHGDAPTSSRQPSIS